MITVSDSAMCHVTNCTWSCDVGCECQEKFHSMKSNGVKTTDLPSCFSVWNLRAQAFVSACDQKWSCTFSLVGQDAILTTAPEITSEKNAETQGVIAFMALTDFLRYHSSKKSESDYFKVQLGEALRGFQGMATAAEVNLITKSVATMMHPQAHSLKELNDALAAMDVIKDSNHFVRALQNLPPSEAWFTEARSHAQKGLLPCRCLIV